MQPNVSGGMPGSPGIPSCPQVPAGTEGGGVLATLGPYRGIRHPMYLAVMLFTDAFAAAGDAWQWPAWAAVLFTKARLEERAMALAHPGYADYRARTRANRGKRRPQQRTQRERRKSMKGKFWISVVAMFVLSMALGFLVHGTLLFNDYARLPNLMRSMEAQQATFPYMLLAHVFLAVGFTWIYLKGREAKPWLAQGIRFGISIAVLTTIPTYLIYFAVMPFPSDLVAQQIVFDTIGMVLMGIAIAWINR